MIQSIANCFLSCKGLIINWIFFVFSGLQRRRLIPALTLDSSPSHRSSKQAITSSSSSSSSPGACWVDGPLGPPAPSNLRGATATAETFEIKVYEIDDVERLQKRRDKGGNKVTDGKVNSFRAKVREKAWIRLEKGSNRKGGRWRKSAKESIWKQKREERNTKEKVCEENILWDGERRMDVGGEIKKLESKKRPEGRRHCCWRRRRMRRKLEQNGDIGSRFWATECVIEHREINIDFKNITVRIFTEKMNQH